MTGAEAIEQLEQGGQILFLDLPAERGSCIIGLDYQEWDPVDARHQVNEDLKSVYLVHSIPPGPHFVSWRQDEGDMKRGKFIYLSRSELIILRLANDSMDRLTDQGEIDSYRKGIENCDFVSVSMGYTCREWLPQWNAVTFAISRMLINKLTPPPKVHRSKVTEYQNRGSAQEKKGMHEIRKAEAELEMPLIENEPSAKVSRKRRASDIEESVSQANTERKICSQDEKVTSMDTSQSPAVENFDEVEYQWEGDTILFTDVPNTMKSGGLKAEAELQSCSGSARSAMAMDKSKSVESVIQVNRQYFEKVRSEMGEAAFEIAALQDLASTLKLEPAECLILGELQLAYVVFLLGHNFSGLMQWKDLLSVLCFSECLDTLHPNLLSQLIRCLYAQISQAPEDLISNELLKSNFIVSAVISINEIAAASEHLEIQRRLKLLKTMIQTKFNMSLEEIWTLQEDGPTVVEVIEEQGPT